MERNASNALLATLRLVVAGATFLCLGPVPLFSYTPTDDACSAPNLPWMDVFRHNGIRSASLSVRFTWNAGVTRVELDKVRYFREYNQTNSTEVTNEPAQPVFEPRLEKSMYSFSERRIKEILKEEAQASGLSRSFGSFVYPVYDDACRTAVYFPPKFNDPDETELMRKAETHDVSELRKLVRDARVVNVRDQKGRTALLHAIIPPESSSTVATLLVSGADPNIPDSRGETALISASQLGELDNVQLLLAHGATVNAQNAYGETALMKTSIAGHRGAIIAQMLLNSGASLNDQDFEGKTALMSAALEGNVEIVKDLLRAGADINIPDKSGKRASDYASLCRAGNAPKNGVIQLLKPQ